ncbi:MAG: CoA pyrophosphatase [Anaerolineales bacterium]
MSPGSTKDWPSRLRKSLSRSTPKIEIAREARPAAVLVPLYFDQGEWHVLLTRRTESVESHRGQVSFPGGLIEAVDSDPFEAAKREAEEELGLLPEDVDVLGSLPTLATVTQFLIVPIIATIPWPYALRPNQAEVASVFGVPLSWLADPAHLEIRRYRPSPTAASFPVHHYEPFQGEVIWGATARIILNLLEHVRPE